MRWRPSARGSFSIWHHGAAMAVQPAHRGRGVEHARCQTSPAARSGTRGTPGAGATQASPHPSRVAPCMRSRGCCRCRAPATRRPATRERALLLRAAPARRWARSRAGTVHRQRFGGTPLQRAAALGIRTSGPLDTDASPCPLDVPIYSGKDILRRVELRLRICLHTPPASVCHRHTNQPQTLADEANAHLECPQGDGRTLCEDKKPQRLVLRVLRVYTSASKAPETSRGFLITEELVTCKTRAHYITPPPACRPT